MKGIVRDRVLHAVFGVAFGMILLVPVLSSFSMRQVQELAITLSLSCVSLALLVITLLLGASSIWRDVEKRYSTSLLTLPIGRADYLFSKYASIALFLLTALLILGAGACLVIFIAASSYPSEAPIHWHYIFLVFLGDFLKYQVLLAMALLLSSVSTSFYLPFFATLILYFCGNASQEVLDYLHSPIGQKLHPLSAKIAMGLYYILPNLSVFDFQVNAVYGLPVAMEGLGFSIVYAVLYTAIILGVSCFAFNRRELP